MIDHVTIRVSDFEESKRFYTTVLEPLGRSLDWEDSDTSFAEWGDFSIAHDARPLTRNLHVAFAASSRTEVDAFHAAAVEAGTETTASRASVPSTTPATTPHTSSTPTTTTWKRSSTTAPRPDEVRALVFHGPGELRIEDVPDPVPGEGDVLVQVEVALTDGTDLKAYRRGHPVLLGPPPSPFGHEACGIDVATGRRVVAANSAPCGDCVACARGQETLCEHLFPLLNGAYAELLLVPERIARRNLLPVPPGLAPEVAAMAEPLACCLHGIDVAGAQRDDVVAVVGLGPIGLMLCACVADAGDVRSASARARSAVRSHRSSAQSRPIPRAPTS